MELKDTVEKMLSDDYKERFRAEVEQVYIRMTKLEKMLEGHQKGTLDFVPTCPIEILELQHKTMQAYFGTLLYRSMLEGIEVQLEV